MPITLPPMEALAQFLGPTTRHTRRVEIYEADGVTRWTRDTTTRLKDGSVTVDYTRDERRALDLTLDNSDRGLVHALGEFWYDKIIKVFRGVAVNSKKRLPKVLIINDQTTDPHATALREALASLGYGDVQTNILATSYALDVEPYDIIISLGGSEDKSGLLVEALRANKSVFVFREAAQKLYDGAFGPGGWTKESVTTPGTLVSPRNVSDVRTLGWRAFRPDSYNTAYNAPKAITATGDTSVYGVAWAGAIDGASASGLNDNFATKDTDKWVWYGAANVTGGTAHVPTHSSYADSVNSVKAYDLTNSAIQVQVTPASGNGGAAGTGLVETYFELQPDETVNANVLYMGVYNGQIKANWRDAGGTDTQLAVRAYDATNDKWWRIRQYDGKVRWETSPDGLAWTELASWVPTFSVSSMQVSLGSGYWETSVTSASDSVWGNVNYKADGTTLANSSGTDGASSFAISSFYSSTLGKAMAVHFPLRSTQYMQTDFYNFLRSAMMWLNPVVPLKLWEVQIGEFMIDRISETNFPHEVKITGRDYTKKCMSSKFSQATMFEGGQSLEGLIGTIAANAGITKRLLPTTGVIVGDTFTFDRNTSRWDAMKQIATAYNYEIYFDATGYLVIRPFLDPTTSAPVVWIETGKAGQIAKYTKSTSDASLFNHILVTGESSDKNVLPVYAESINNDPNSPTNVDEIGDRYWEYSSSLITDQQQAQNLADSYLKLHSLEEFELAFDTLMMPWLEVGDILGFIDPNPAPGDPTTFLLSSLTLPLGLSPMSGLGKRVLIVGV